MSLTEVKSQYSKFSEEIQEELAKYPSVITLPVLWGHMDAYQHVNNMWYLQFCELGRVDHAMLLGLYMDPKELADRFSGKANGLVVKQNSIKYIRPVKFPDSLTVATRVKDLTNDSLVYDIKLYSNASGKLATECEVLMVGFDFKLGKKCNIDALTIEAITKLEDDPKSSQKLAKKVPSRAFYPGI